MKKFFGALLLSMTMSTPALAVSLDFGMADGLEFVSDTRIPVEDGDSTLSLCYQTRGLQILGYQLNSDIRGYALSEDQCQTAAQTFSADQVITAQSLNLVDADIPPVPSNDLQRDLPKYAIVGGALLLITIIARWLIKLVVGSRSKGQVRVKAASRILNAMCYMAKCDGLVGSNEIPRIVETAQRLTGYTYNSAEVMRMADKIDLDLTAHDFIAFGKGLRDKEKDLMIRSVLYIGMADGRMQQAEHDFATELATGLGMPADDFRRMLNVALADLDEFPASL